jgi:hypothetical protein
VIVTSEPSDGVFVGVAVCVGVPVCVGVRVIVGVEVCVGVLVGVRVEVGVDVNVGGFPQLIVSVSVVPSPSAWAVTELSDVFETPCTIVIVPTVLVPGQLKSTVPISPVYVEAVVAAQATAATPETP